MTIKSTCLFIGLGCLSAIAQSTEFFIGCTGGEGEIPGIYLATIDESTGIVSDTQQVAPLAGASFQALSPDGNLLASASSAGETGQNVHLFSVSPDGSLSPKGSSQCGKGGTCHVSFDATGKVIFAANYGNGSVSSSQVLETGSLSDTVSFFKHEGSGPNAGRQKSPHAHSIYAGPSNTFAYAPDLGIDATVIYRFNAETAEMTQHSEAKSAPGAGPRHMKFGKDGKFAYVLNELNTTVEVFSVGPDGLLTLTQTVSTLPEDFDTKSITCSEIRVSPDGRFIYTANRDTAKTGRDVLSTLSINSDDGSLSLIETVPAGVIIPRNITVSPSGKWLIASGQVSNQLSIFKIHSSDGTLTQTDQTIDVPSPMCVTFR